MTEHNRNITLPSPFHFAPGVLPTSVYYFTDVALGISSSEDFNFTAVEPPNDLSGYAIANSQDFYLTPSPQYIIPLFLNTPSIFFSEFDSYFEITIIDVFRLDLISYHYYSTPEYWWIIALANNILDPFNLVPGTILRIPSESTVTSEWIQRPVKKVRNPESFFFGTL